MIIRRKAARAVTRTNDAGLALVNYSGLLTEADFDELRGEVMDHLTGSRIALVDMWTVVPLSGDYGRVATPGLWNKARSHTAVLIVQPDQLGLWTRYALKCAMRGICRVPFVSASKATRWAEERLP